MAINKMLMHSNRFDPRQFKPEISFNKEDILISSSKFLKDGYEYNLTEDSIINVPKVSENSYIDVWVVMEIASKEVILVVDVVSAMDPIRWIPDPSTHVKIHNLISGFLPSNFNSLEDCDISVYIVDLPVEN